MKHEAHQLKLLDENTSPTDTLMSSKTTKERLHRLDVDGELRHKVISFCRLQRGQIWEDPIRGHRVGVLDATNEIEVNRIMGGEKARLVIADPPYNLAVGGVKSVQLFKLPVKDYIDFSRMWIVNALSIMDADSYLYIWTGADYRDNFQPLPDLMILLREFRHLRPYNFITLRNQRGYGTQRNWMWIRQELLSYAKGNPNFNVDAEYTDIPKILSGYYKLVKGKITENLERSRSKFIRAGNVWVDIQQVFYRMEENVPGCYAQKPLRAMERIISASSGKNELVVDFFAHAGSGLIAGERQNRKVATFDIDPIFTEISIRRLEHYRATGKTGWQWENPFPEIQGTVN